MRDGGVKLKQTDYIMGKAERKRDIRSLVIKSSLILFIVALFVLMNYMGYHLRTVSENAQIEQWNAIRNDCYTLWADFEPEIRTTERHGLVCTIMYEGVRFPADKITINVETSK